MTVVSRGVCSLGGMITFNPPLSLGPSPFHEIPRGWQALSVPVILRDLSILLATRGNNDGIQLGICRVTCTSCFNSLLACLFLPRSIPLLPQQPHLIHLQQTQSPYPSSSKDGIHASPSLCPHLRHQKYSQNYNLNRSSIPFEPKYLHVNLQDCDIRQSPSCFPTCAPPYLSDSAGKYTDHQPYRLWLSRPTPYLRGGHRGRHRGRYESNVQS